MAAPPSRRASPPVLPDELVEEILLRLPPDEPAWLLRASLISKDWGRTISSPAFRRRLHDFHGAPPVLGFLHEWRDERVADFVPTTASAFSLAAPDRRSWKALDYRHGRALFLSKGQGTEELLLWEPITGAQQRVPVPAAFESYDPTAAVFCAADACDHRDCHGGPFRVVFLFTKYDIDIEDDEYVTSACLYSSETGSWGELTSTQTQYAMDFDYYSNILVGRSLVYFMSTSWLIVEYDYARHRLRVFEAPEECDLGERCTLMLTDGGGLGVTEVTEGWNPRLKLWSRVDASDDGTDARWVLSRDINLESLLRVGALASVANLLVLGFAEEANVIFLNTCVGLFMIELQSERVRKVCDDRGACLLIPVVSFYTPVPRSKHPDPPLLNTTEVAASEEEEERRRREQ